MRSGRVNIFIKDGAKLTGNFKIRRKKKKPIIYYHYIPEWVSQVALLVKNTPAYAG